MAGRRTTTRERLVRTAAELFWRQGYAATGVNAIMQQAGATSGSFYHFFPTKEDLLLAVLDHVGDVVEDEVFGAAEVATDDPIERIFAVVGFYRRHLEDNKFVLGSPLGTLAAELGEDHAQVRLKLEQLLASWAQRMEGFLDAVGKRLPDGTDRTALARLVLSAVEGAVIQARVARSVAPFDAVTSQLQSYLELLAGHDLTAAPAAIRTPSLPRQRSRELDWRAW